MKNNKKKANKEKRVMAAALCITAVAVAGSTFAWFTSSDEVTNRLSANADYNVSIVESFAPPENWLPGTSVNKDVYATNTGNIGAFVREDVSGVLTITNEKPVDTFGDDCVELKPEERYVMEAGSFLAYKPEASNAKLGNQIVIRPGDNNGVPAETDFTPDKDGLYVFRRKIVVDKNTRAEEFKYEGYYYSGGKFYKISNLKVTPDTTIDLANDGVSNDGNLSAASSGFYKEVTETINPVDLEYVADDDGKRLVATYDTGVVNQAYTDLESAAARLDAANHNVEYLTQLVNKATDENDDSSGTTDDQKDALDAAKDALDAALAQQRTAATALLNATTAYNNAAAAQASAQAAYNASKNKLYGSGSFASPAEGSLQKKYNDASAAKTAWTNAHPSQAQALEDEVNAWAESHPDGVDESHTTLAQLTVEELQKFTPSAELHELYELTAAELIAERNLNNETTKAYGNYPGSESNYTPESLYGKLQAANSDLTAKNSEKTTATNNKTTADNAVTTAQNTYNNAYAAYIAALGNSGDTADTLKDLQAKLTAAENERTAANNAYSAATAAAGAVNSGTNLLKFNIYLSDDVETNGGTAGKWQLLPNAIANENIAHFYYTSILDAGETSNKLIDRVELDPSANQDMYKSFDFDINVGLKSAQIVLDEDQETILATAAKPEIGQTPTLVDPKNIDTALTWS